MMKEVVRPPFAITDMICTYNLNLVIETFSQLVFSTLYLRLNSSQSQMSLGLWMVEAVQPFLPYLDYPKETHFARTSTV